MAINFPNNPAVNDTFTVGGTTFTFTGVKWESSAVVELSSDTTPSLGGDLDGGAKNINNVGVITATSFSGSLTGNADTATSATSATTATTATNAQGLTGDPSIQVTNATVLGNLDVQGTTTTIDTAITEVDSLNVEGSVGIGTTNPGAKLEIRDDSSTGIIIRSGSTQATDTNKALRVRNNSDTNTFHVSHKGQGYFAGSVGIGTDNPQSDFHILDTIPRITLEDSDSGRYLTRWWQSGNATVFDIDSENTGGSPYFTFKVGGTEKLRIFSGGSATFTGTVSDSIGSLRDVPLNDQSSNASYTLVASDAGKVVHAHSTTTTVVVPNSVFSAGNVVTILNGGTSNITITQGSGLSLRNSGDGSTGNRTLAQFGMATIYFTGASVGYISGSNMT